jgi:hypothetical protein
MSLGVPALWCESAGNDGHMTHDLPVGTESEKMASDAGVYSPL